MHWYYAAKSDLPLRAVCKSLRDRFNLPPFTFDTHDNWEYGWSERAGLHLNVTRADDDTTIQGWMADCPPGVNYQVIVTSASQPPEIVDALSRALEAAVQQYAQRP
jgi:hypothetical protein